ncbi:putative GNAT superfamily acetyltransferase [Rhizobium sp. SG_E_25_P2]|uniref:GNAT family N-acetyltransferase n=1 Tax=Rhizobium sp. SG_E_25_P2 TaxID=2879942 RepID=UPI002473DA69|nr:GNAT family N-acetyltransferase [Rhizobium sp. SG_E_25_P2]MDH6265961.1 putative GNAT superfamily acetyltransferase [Rhizobium sp. SG_E_25_P2]
MTEIHIRELRGIAEFRKAEGLQTEVWGRGDTPDPADLMMVIQEEGGLVAGAFLDSRLVGYVFGFPTRDPGVQHSHRLAVAPDMRGRGLGADLKWFQRDWCLARGINHVRWTFDPLRITNARLNLNRLGGRSCAYLVDYYGEMGGINKGLPSDRLLLDWRLDDPIVVQRAQGARMDGGHEGALLVHTVKAEMEGRSENELLEDLGRLRWELQDAFSMGYHLVGVIDRTFMLMKR